MTIRSDGIAELVCQFYFTMNCCIAAVLCCVCMCVCFGITKNEMESFELLENM